MFHFKKSVHAYLPFSGVKGLMESQDFDPSEVILGMGVPADGWSGTGRFGKLHFYWRISLTAEEGFLRCPSSRHIRLGRSVNGTDAVEMDLGPVVWS